MTPPTDAIDMPMRGYIAALTSLEGMTNTRLRTLLTVGDPAVAYAVAVGRRPAAGGAAKLLADSPALRAMWAAHGAHHADDECWSRCLEHSIEVLTPTDPTFPVGLLNDPACPAALFVQGDIDSLAGRRVGIVGTRNATRAGRQTAARFGAELAAAGVTVVSGLASGIDGAAHRGALSVPGSRPVGVVGNGLDRPYPRHHTDLWRDVARCGVLLSEWPPGTPPDAFRFPRRNGILAALIEVLVVVESRNRGGSLITAREAANRDVEIFAVPGSVDNAASEGTNSLLRDGAAPAVDTADILMALDLDHRRDGVSRYDPRPLPRGVASEIVEFCTAAPRTLGEIAERLGSDLAGVAMAVARLERDGWLHDGAGWFEVVDSWADLA